MLRLALMSFHGCPVARLGEKDTGGMNVYVLQMAREFARRGHHVDVYTRAHDPSDPQIVELGPRARVIHLKAGPYKESKAALSRYIPAFMENLDTFRKSEGLEYDLIHSHYWLSGRIGLTLRHRWNVPHVATFHTLAKTKLRARAGEREPDVRSTVEKQIIEHADAVIVSTEQEREDLVRLYGARPQAVQVIPAGVDLELFHPIERLKAREALGLSENGVILYVGRVEPLKGLDLLIQAVALLEEKSDVKVLIVGGRLGEDEEIERLKAMVAELGLDGRVEFTGAVDQTRLPLYYSAADVFVLPSYYESFGLAALESMACGTPVVASRVGGLKTFIKEGETGYLIPWRCPEPFAQRLDVLLSNPGLRASMGSASTAVARRMSWTGVSDRMLKYFTCLIDGRLERAAGA